MDQTKLTSRMDQYRAWLDERWAEWRKIEGIPASERLTYGAYRAFDAWLAFRLERARLDPGQVPAVASAG